jgi:hypothetical protein
MHDQGWSIDAGGLARYVDTPWREHKAVEFEGPGRREEALVLAREQLELARGWGSRHGGAVAASARDARA